MSGSGRCSSRTSRYSVQQPAEALVHGAKDPGLRQVVLDSHAALIEPHAALALDRELAP